MLPEFYCKRKTTARTKTIIDIYRKYFDDSIPNDRQYWTMCASQVKNNKLQENSELGQMLHSKLINANQFYGVDIDKDVIVKNRKIIPEATWINNDFKTAMQQYQIKSNFNPAIINADFICMGTRAVPRSSEILSFVADIDVNNILMIANIMVTNPYEHKFYTEEDIFESSDKIFEQYKKNKSFLYAVSQGWKIHEDYYVYPGSGKNVGTFMTSYMFYKK